MWRLRPLLSAVCALLPGIAAAQSPPCTWSPAYGGDDPIPRLEGVEREASESLKRALVSIGSAPCRLSSKLTDAARAHANEILVSRTPPGKGDTLRARHDVQCAGGIEPSVVPWALAYASQPIDLDPRLMRLAERLSGRPATHCGFGVATSPERNILVVMGARRRVALERFPARLTTGDTMRLAGLLSEGYCTPQVLVTNPMGDVLEQPTRSRGTRFWAQIGFPMAGRYTVEVMASGARGPEAVALFPAFVDCEPSQSAEPVVAASDPGRAATVLLRLFNQERTRAGLAPLEVDSDLSELALRHTRDMIERGYFGHVSPSGEDLTTRLDGAGLYARRATENVARATSATRAHATLTGSPAHRANMLDPEVTHIGIGAIWASGELLATEIYVAW